MNQQLGPAAGAAISAVLLAEGPVGFTIANPKGDDGPVVFVSTDPQYGELNLVIQNNTADPVGLDVSSQVKLYLWPLLTSEEVGKIEIAAASGWEGHAVPDEEQHLHLELRPVKPLTLAPLEPVTIEMSGALASGDAARGRFRVEYAGFGTIRPGAQSIPAMRHFPPDQVKDWPLKFGLGTRQEYGGSLDQGRAIYVTPWAVTPAKAAIFNTFVLQISAIQPFSFLSSDKPTLSVSFLTGNTDGSLCSDDEIKKVIAGIDQNPGDPWGVGKDALADLPVFEITPLPGTTTFGMKGPLAIRFGNLATTLPPDKSSPILIQFTGMTTCNDGFAIVDLDKTDPVPFLRSFGAYAGETEIPQAGTTNYGPITLKWDVFAAETCLLLGQKVFDSTDTFTFTPDKLSYIFTLQPQVGTQQFPNASVQFAVMPAVVSVTAKPDKVAPNSPTVLSVSCTNAGHCNIVSSYGSVVYDGPPPNGPVTAHVGPADTTFTVTCTGASTAVANVKVQVPPVQAMIGARLTTAGGMSVVMIAWRAYYANTCEVTIVDRSNNVMHISTQLGGTKMLSRANQDCDFKIVAVGIDTVTKTTKCLGLPKT
jgi:hypothetical protein